MIYQPAIDTDYEATKVVFRVWDGQVIALFPEIKADCYDDRCLCFAHIGQHSSANYQQVIDRSVDATPEQYAALFNELSSRPYNYVLWPVNVPPTHVMYYQPTMELTGIFPDDLVWRMTWDDKPYRIFDLWFDMWIGYQYWQMTGRITYE